MLPFPAPHNLFGSSWTRLPTYSVLYRSKLAFFWNGAPLELKQPTRTEYVMYQEQPDLNFEKSRLNQAVGLAYVATSSG